MNHWNFRELHETPSQTGGPYVHIGLLPQQANIEVFENNFNNQLVQEKTLGERIRLEGQVFDGLGLPLRDVLIEIWQADANGVYPSAADIQGKVVDPNFLGWGRTGADFETGFWSFNTVKPGAVPGRKGTTQAPHIALIIFARGINIGLNTRVYFEDEAEANAQDPVLKGIEWAPRRQTLIAKREERDGEVVYRFDIRVQGEDETVFLDI
ncbi:protocatechuate 3,4-dioxygenase subunit alpha [Acinetobacter terrae]|jgi:protocatechuate 3,4-dioxygenase alpha subunit|uniref:Protocatechuate 3,4-dioxygenase subunit alpha n=1 Tax=Acinetobacter terrae TaxID=2731247 RepID=A0A7Y2LF93_9GAMM|nr:protocatechuate 3,4-dioxygenase subunit alpha [Acinetobacter terrae]NNG77694.1 protocatechuate 3,4-dioxygenase subunit alpha [Acinetobacter terrae]NNH17038.1 protocatechuate 3,4-dioxygenase subunit alpha [Acinetobacter terrae]NNH39931.1 protocatechuate 3,4-dioxygenase subunit alpha [Acinetobacter terrae]NNH89174.1 protocatechuate 3,4-dioxygenase subunit alpha [Acinetobacter terrae]